MVVERTACQLQDVLILTHESMYVEERPHCSYWVAVATCTVTSSEFVSECMAQGDQLLLGVCTSRKRCAAVLAWFVPQADSVGDAPKR
jgi:hypothetical protein